MCGICGYAGDHQPDLLETMSESMTHRGPDGSGVWWDEGARVGLGHRRLQVIDLSDGGRQPMASPDGSVVLSYNGELYDFREHRQELEARGHVFRGHSDTEVLLHLYQEHGIDFLQRLNGMFAFALWDARKRELLLVRDHAGIKPLYYWMDGGRIFFASEIKALLRVPGIPREPNLEALHDYLRFLWVPGDQTMLRAVRKLEPGQFLRWRDGQATTHTWFTLHYEPDPGPTEDEWAEAVRETFLRTTRRQMVSDVRLGAFLSGGLDSSSIVACMRDSFPDREIATYTVRFDSNDMARDQGVDDYPYAKLVAEHLDVHLRGVVLKPNVIRLLPKMVYHLDEPDADPAVFPSYLISKLAREDGTTVLLSGTGGDEVFFGYRSHLAYRQYERMRWLGRYVGGPLVSAGAATVGAFFGAQNRLARRLAKFQRGLGPSALDRHVALSEWSSQATRNQLVNPSLRTSPDADPMPPSMRHYYDSFRGEGDLNRHSHMLIQSFLAAHNFLYTDKTSMASSVETRVPFMDVELMRLCARIPEHMKLRRYQTKAILKRALRDYLPPQVLHRAKAGFGAPLRQWIAEDLHTVIEELLGPRRLRERGLFEPEVVGRILEENRTRRADHAYLIYALLNLELWLQTFVDRAGEEIAL